MIGTRESEYTVFEDGVYEVSFDAFFPEGEDGLPYLVLQERFGEEVLVIRFRTSIDGEEGPPGTIDPEYELPALVRAFGGDPTALQEETSIGRKLLKAQKLMVGSTKVTVSNSWIQIGTMQGMGVPESFYYLRLSRVTSKTEAGKLGPVEGKYGPYVIGRAKVTRGNYKGTEVPFFLGYPLVVGEDGIPGLPLKLDGDLTVASKRYKNYLLAFYGSDYADFPHQDCEDVQNITPLLTKIMLERNVEALGYVDERSRVDLNKLGPVPDDEKRLEEPKLPESVFTPAQEALRMMMVQEVGIHKNADAFVDGERWDLTPEGKEWARETLAAGGEKSILKEYGLSRLFGEWDDSAIENVLRVLDYNKQGQKLGQDEIPF